MSVVSAGPEPFELVADVLVIGAGACGLCAALAARDGGADVVVLERDKTPLGTTAMSTGLIPGAGTRLQREAGIDDDPVTFAEDLLRKSNGTADAGFVHALCAESALTVDWLVDRHHIPLSLFKAAESFPGHSRARLHGTPNRSGEELVASLLSAAIDAEANIVTDARVTALVTDPDRTVRGVIVARPDGSSERVGCRTLILATCGFAGNAEMIAQFIPELAGIDAHTHPGAQGDALRWGAHIGAATADLDAYQGHANVAAGHGLLISWLSVSEGGFQVTSTGHRFSDESRGYSEQAVDVAAQPGGFAWTIYDERIDQIMSEIGEYRDARAAGATMTAASVADLARAIRVPVEALAETMSTIAALCSTSGTDRFGRQFSPRLQLHPPFMAAKVRPALFHTQGGLVVDRTGRVIDTLGVPLPNLFAGGGAARGVSGAGAGGYVAGNGLMSATTLGRIAGRTAARQVAMEAKRQEMA